MKPKKKQKKWLRSRHKAVRALAYWLIVPYIKWKYHIRADRFRAQGKRAYLILMNHQTSGDQFFVGMSFSGPVYYLASEDLFSNGWISSLLRWALAPIPIKKQVTDPNAVRNCIRVAREGGTIAIAPEGNRTYSGKTEYISPSIAPLAKKLALPIALYRIEGGYGVQPRWSDVTRKGKLHGYVSQVIEPEEYRNMTDEALFSRIEQGLYVDEGVSDGLFLSDKRAEYLERAVYVCPHCGLSEFESHGNVIECKKCRRQIEYGQDKRLRGVGFDFPFAYVTQWYAYQKQFVNALDLLRFTDAPLYREHTALSEVILNKRKRLLRKDAALCLYGDRITIDEGTPAQRIFPFAQITAISVLGRNKLNIYIDNHVYQFKSGKRFNALKYVNFCFRFKNIRKGEPACEFLGL